MLILYILSYDIWFYISHIILHQPNFYRTIHKVHHSVESSTLRYKDTYISHLLESPVQGIGILFPLLFLQFHALTMIYSLIIINIRGMLRHDTRYIWLIGNHHILHHKYPQYNFGEYWLDKLGGTMYPNDSEYKIGLIYI